MTERGRDAVTRDATKLTIGPSRLAWQADRLVLALDEIAAPVPRRIRGTITVDVGPRLDHAETLDAAGRHRWSLIAPSARVAVDLDAPDLHWTGVGYMDTNRGTRALEDDFVRWNWSRAHRPDGSAAIVYDVERCDGSRHAIAQAVSADGRLHAFAAPPVVALPRTSWRLAPSTRSDDGTVASVRMPLEDGPFYSRAVIDATWDGEPVVAVHEHLALDRFERRWVRGLLPFRMPRRGRW